MEELRSDERITLEASALVFAEFKIGKESEEEQLWCLDVLDYSRFGLGLMITKIDSELVQILNTGYCIKDMTLYTEWAMIKTDATVRHIRKVTRGTQKDQYILGVESNEIIAIFKPIKEERRDSLHQAPGILMQG